MPRLAGIAFILLPIIAAELFVAADAGAQPVDTDPVPQVLLRGIQQPKEAYLAAQLKPIRAHGADRVRIDQQAIDMVKMDAVASARAQLIGRLMIRDRDGDGRITAEEVRQSLEMRNIGSRPTLSPEQAQARLTTRMAAEMAADADKDDVITLAELLAFANE